jgi:type II secretory pathway component PulF
MFGLFRTPSRAEDLALFTRHVAGAMNARAPLGDILRGYVKDCEHGALARAVEEITDRVEAGVALSEAMERHGAFFPPAYRRLVRLGEQSKTLGGVMEQLADSLEQGLTTYEYYRRAAIYPLLIVVLLFLDLCVLKIMIAPRFEQIYQDMGVEFPGIFSPDAVMSWVFSGVGLVLIVCAMFLLASVLGLRVRGLSYGRLALSVPFFGPILRRLETARFSHSLSLLLGNRLPLAESLGLLADSAESKYVRAAIKDFHQRCQQGERLSEMLAGQPLFPASMAVMIASAEDQGGLAETLRGLSRFYALRTMHGISVLREVFEPLMLLLIGLLVALVLLSFYLPMFMMPRLIPF